MTLENVFFTADTHWGYSKSIEFKDRAPFGSVFNVQRHMQAQFRDCLDENSLLIHLGDVGALANFTEACLPKGAKFALLCGNHDDVDHNIKPDWIDWICGWPTVFILRKLPGCLGEMDIVVSHEPPWAEKEEPEVFRSVEVQGSELNEVHCEGMIETMSANRRRWWVHGHSHNLGRATRIKGFIDVGVDGHNFRPWSVQELVEEFTRRQLRDTRRMVSLNETDENTFQELTRKWEAWKAEQEAATAAFS